MTLPSDKAQLLRADGRKKEVRFFSGKAAVGLGATIISFGIIVIAAQITILALYNLFFTNISQGLWCGAVFILTGVIGVVAGKRRTGPWVIAFIVFCIFVCLFAGVLIGLSAVSSVFSTVFGTVYIYQNPCGHQVPRFPPSMPDPHYYTGYYNGYAGYMNSYGSRGCYALNVPWAVQFSMNIIMAAFGVFTAIIAIIACTLSCAPICCNPEKKEEEDDTHPSHLPLEAPPYYELPNAVMPGVLFVDMATGQVTAEAAQQTELPTHI
jgi:hypothetical protein